MGSSLLPGGDTTPPVDQPVPPGSDSFTSSAPSWVEIGSAFAKGQSLVNNPQATQDSWLEWVKNGIAKAVGVVLGLLLWVAQQIMDVWSRATDTDLAQFDGIVKRSLSHVFGVSQPGATPRAVGSGVDTAGSAAAIGKQIEQAMFAGVNQATPGAITPSSTAAESFLGLMARIGIEGWLEGFVGEMCSLGYIEAMMQLVPIMNDVLGLGRLSRRALAAPMKILIEDPFTYNLQQLYRPTLLSEGVALKQMIRDSSNAAKWRTELQLRGYSEDRIDALANDAARFLSLDDTVYLVDSNAWTLDQAVQYLGDQGYDQATAQNLIAIFQAKRNDQFQRDILTAAGDAYVKGDLSDIDWNNTLNSVELQQWEKAGLAAKYGTLRALKRTHLSPAEIVQAINVGVYSEADLTAALTREGYPEDEQTAYELTQLAKVSNKQQAAAAKRKAAELKAQAAAAKAQAAAAAKAAKLAAEQDKGLSITQFEALVKDGQRTLDEYNAFLLSKKYSQEDAASLTQLLSDAIDAAKAKAAKAAALKAQPKAKAVNIAQLEKGVTDGFLSLDDYSKRLAQAGYSTDDAALLVSELQDQLAAAKAKQQAHDAASAKLKAKGVDLAQEELSVKLGVHSIQDYQTFLQENGFDAAAVDTLTGIMQSQLDTLTAQRQAKQAAAAKLKTKGLSLSTLDKAVISGVRDMAWYKEQLANQGISADDQAALAAILQVTLDKNTATAAARTAAAAKLKTKDVSLSTVEALVVSGDVPMSTLVQEMNEAGVDADSQQLIQLSVAEKIAKARAAQAKQAKPPKPPKPPDLTIAQNEAAVLAGAETPAQYQAELVKAGYTPDDIAQLMALLQVKIDAAAAKAAKGSGKP